MKLTRKETGRFANGRLEIFWMSGSILMEQPRGRKPLAKAQERGEGEILTDVYRRSVVVVAASRLGSLCEEAESRFAMPVTSRAWLPAEEPSLMCPKCQSTTVYCEWEIPFAFDLQMFWTGCALTLVMLKMRQHLFSD